jgi:cytidylate kinase
MTTRVITIDGGAGVGGSTVAKALGQSLGCDHLNIGETYRALTYELVSRGWNKERIASEPTEAAQLAAGFELAIAGGSVARVDDRDCEGRLHAPEISKLVPTLAAIPEMRATAKAIEREFIATRPLSIIEGRAGAWGIPQAVVKIWLYCEPEIAAQRRGCSVQEVLERNHADATRQHSPMLKHPEAVALDTSRITPKEIVEQIVQLYHGLQD